MQSATTIRTPRHPRKTFQVVCLTLLAISSILPVMASIDQVERPATWVGLLDVALAAALAAVLIAAAWQTRSAVNDSHRARAYTWIRNFSAGILFMVVLGITGTLSIEWDVLLIGLGWRVWLTIMTLPGLIALESTSSTRRT